MYVGLTEPAAVKRSLLEMQRDVILALKRFDTVSEMRRNKLKELVALRRCVNTASQALAHLKVELPHVEGSVGERMESAVSPSPERRQAPVQEHHEEISLLDRELSDIEAKLKKL